MKITKIAILILAIAAVLYILIPSLSWAEDGTSLSKAQCSAFHAMRIRLGLSEVARGTDSSLRVNAMRRVEAERPTGNAKKP